LFKNFGSFGAHILSSLKAKPCGFKKGKRTLLFDLLRKMFKSEVGGGGRHHRLHVYRVQAVLQAAGTRAGTSLFVCNNKHRKELC
jgi:hypothetical protein